MAHSLGSSTRATDDSEAAGEGSRAVEFALVLLLSRFVFWDDEVMVDGGCGGEEMGAGDELLWL